MKGKKYKQGEPYTNFISLLEDLKSENFVYWGNVVKHPSIIKNMSINTLETAIKNQMVKRAIRNGAVDITAIST